MSGDTETGSVPIADVTRYVEQRTLLVQLTERLGGRVTENHLADGGSSYKPCLHTTAMWMGPPVAAFEAASAWAEICVLVRGHMSLFTYEHDDNCTIEVMISGPVDAPRLTRGAR